MEKAEKVRKIIGSLFKLNGLQIRSEATNYLVGILAPLPDREPEIWAERIVDRILKVKLKTPLVDKATVETAAKECGKGNAEDKEDIVTFISAFDVPKYSYNADKKKFILVKEASELICKGEHKPLMYKNRYAILLQRTYHHDLFNPTMGTSGENWEENKKKFQLRPVEFLAGSSSKVEGVVVLGMISQMKEGKYFIEDNSGSMELDITCTKFHSGLYAEYCFVLAEGMYDDGIFYVHAMGLPPPETALVTKSYHGTVNFFGGSHNSISNERLEVIERQNEGAMFVILSDVYLDKVSVLEKLKVLFEGYSDSPPVMFILMGNFLSEPLGPVVLKDCFKALADIISESPHVMANSKFVIVPGPSDPGFTNVLPRPPYAKCIISYVQEKIPNAVFATNPFRIRYCTKNIVIFREDIVSKLARNSIYFPASGDIPKELVSTLAGQAHLCPLPLHICPIYWSLDHALSLYPLPDLVILGDKCNPFTETNTGCIFTNPGSFLKTDFSFKVYTPFEGKIEDCQLPSD